MGGDVNDDARSTAQAYGIGHRLDHAQVADPPCPLKRQVGLDVLVD